MHYVTQQRADRVTRVCPRHEYLMCDKISIPRRRARVRRRRVGLLEFEWKIFRIRRVPSLHANKSSPFHAWILNTYFKARTRRSFFSSPGLYLLNVFPMKIPRLGFARDCGDFYIRWFRYRNKQHGRWKPMANRVLRVHTAPPVRIRPIEYLNIWTDVIRYFNGTPHNCDEQPILILNIHRSIDENASNVLCTRVVCADIFSANVVLAKIRNSIRGPTVPGYVRICIWTCSL